jgi:phenylpropionate dioxygenase-like ring-hydroxylating dioxygenase large terminal subunit
VTAAQTAPTLPSPAPAGATRATMPAWWYDDAQHDRAERASIFRRTWQVAGLSRDVAQPGSYLAADLAGMPVLVTRDADGELRAFANVCPHRGMLLASGCGDAKLIQCPNHSWVFRLDGTLRSAPRSEREPGFCRDGLDLRPLGVVQWGPLVLVCPDPAVPVPQHELELMRAEFEQYGISLDDLEAHGEPVDWEMDCNWKILVENYLECYHCATVHPGFSKVFDVSQDGYTYAAHGSLLTASSPVKATRDPERQRQILETSGRVTASHWYVLFPALTVNVYPGEGAVEITWYWPTDAHHSRGRTIILHPPGVSSEYAAQILALSLEVSEEDNRLCEGMQVGMSSGAIDREYLLGENEALLLRFHELVQGALA